MVEASLAHGMSLCPGVRGRERRARAPAEGSAAMTLEGWEPQIGPYLTLGEVIDFAFDYRGNTTIVKTDGTEVVGYIFNRDARTAEPFLQYFDERGDGPFTLPYAAVAAIKFTGKDTAAGGSFKAWLERKERSKAEAAGAQRGEAAPDSHRG